MSELIVSGTAIRRDLEGRYSLNDLHRAAGGEKRHGPSYWLAVQQTKDLIDELATTGIPVVTLEGRGGGTYVAKELVYAYAMWISPAFHLKASRAYDQAVPPPSTRQPPWRILARCALLGYAEKSPALGRRWSRSRTLVAEQDARRLLAIAAALTSTASLLRQCREAGMVRQVRIHPPSTMKRVCI